MANLHTIFVDDEMYSLDGYIRELRDRGTRVTGINNSDSAMQLFHRCRNDSVADFDIIILDMHMPLPSGDHRNRFPTDAEPWEVGAYLLDDFRSWCELIPVLIFSQRDEVEEVIPAVHRILQTHYSDVNATTNVDQMRDELRERFLVWTASKSGRLLRVTPFVDELDRIIVEAGEIWRLRPPEHK